MCNNLFTTDNRNGSLNGLTVIGNLITISNIKVVDVISTGNQYFVLFF